MAVRKFKPVTPGTRHKIIGTFDEITTNVPEKSLVSVKKSSNGKILFNECKKVNPNSHLIDSAEEIDNRLLIGTESIGICGATSTPKWLMEEISKAIKSRI